MNHSSKAQTQHLSAITLTKMALITALYVVITLFLAPFSYGPIQLRLSEMFNYLGILNKRYIWSITLGVAIANTQSPLGIVDVIVGSLSTLIFLWLSYYVTTFQKNLVVKMITTAIIFSLSMFTVAGTLTISFKAPFLYTWLTVAIGELLSMAIGGIIIYLVNKKIDLAK